MNYPNFIKPLDINKERISILNEFKTKSGKLDYIPLIGDDYVTLTDIFLYRLNNFIELLNIKIANNYLNFSSGEYLDELVKLAGLKRNDEVKPIAEVEISVSSPTFLPKGTILTDTKGHNAYLMADANITDKAVLKIQAEGYFKENYETTTLQIPNIYVSQITLKTPFSGFKARESDEELRERFLLSLHRFSTAGSKKSYLFYILSVEGISKANVYHLSPGVVQIVFLSNYDEAIATAKIKEALSDRIPLTDEVRIKPANILNLDLTLKITPKQDFMFSQIITDATKQITEFFNSLTIEQTPHVSQIIDVAFTQDVKAVEVMSNIPTSDRDSIIRLNHLNIIKGDNNA
ncbi:baseplate J/gp47 family protein [Campylobacter mucosalis]|uniref:Phage baseplate assembly protein J, putative n=1 Tax=Campylobacter mucosalis CCUG 21559 TaxID=1032067 RepID=A0A6G5QG26_9BACT|nr:baseplate J/gp47 family protein [Campylobacter mucosalis]QCD44456.1 phage baseplate assembly protein J, putative [Campylobacter mucosalis CCUG 21559]